MPQVLDPVHEILNGRPRIAVMGSKDLFNRIELRLFGYCGGFSTHHTHFSIPLKDGGSHYQIVGKLRPAQLAFVLKMFSFWGRVKLEKDGCLQECFEQGN
ncbi:hypothetical protein MOV66_04490 [Agrobacterium sp. SHOUNA12C]|nr:hypothetical protein [Agrobacterium sp. BETTINA12B]MCJ9755890.1 hypothetical protein [Agrobacterium sp. SHOUNA12C]